MAGKIPPDAFAFYVGLGPSRSYRLVGQQYGVTMRGVVKRARREKWGERLREIEAAARRVTDANLTESFNEINERHRKMLRAMASRSMAALAQYPLDNGMDGIRGAEKVIRLERLIMEQPTQRTAVTVQATTKDEIERFLVGETDGETQADDEDDPDDDYGESW